MAASDQPDHTGADEPALPYASPYHTPVLCHAVVHALVTAPDGLYVDGTLGGGGHTAALLDALAPAGRVIGLDRDTDALAAARHRLRAAEEAGRFQALRGRFGDLDRLLAEAGLTQIDGLLLDLGISSHQIDAPARGFSHRQAGPLDMRMNAGQEASAQDLVNTQSEVELRDLLRAYGEEPQASRIARAIVRQRPLDSTESLADLVRSQVPARHKAKTLARVFQALRIAVNEELAELEAVLKASVNVVRPGGRIAVISYHSLEDRRVKRFLRYGNLEGQPVRDLYGTLITPWRPLVRKPIEPDADEQAANPRSRSARLRVAERVHTAPTES
ncbi:MAG: 16S rRNA (cytosine(1402)-N(4))-methyltransferase RsmH [Bacteroidota bacterium]